MTQTSKQNSDNSRKKEFIPKKHGDQATIYVTPTYTDIFDKEEKIVGEEELQILNEFLSTRKLKDLVWTGISLVLQHRNLGIPTPQLTNQELTLVTSELTSNIALLNNQMGQLTGGFGELTQVMDQVVKQAQAASKKEK